MIIWKRFFILKVDLVVSENKSVSLNEALKRVHTARHPPLLNFVLKLGEVSRNMVSVPEGALEHLSMAK